MPTEKNVLFGAGRIGTEIIDKHIYEIVAVIDNDKEKQGYYIQDNIPIISLSEYINNYNGVPIIIAVFECNEIIRQLKKNKLYNYRISSEIYRDYNVSCDNEISHDNWISYLSERFNKTGCRVLEVGSRVVTGACNREKFRSAEYIGFDIYEGDNVDVVGDAHILSSYFDDKFDLIFCSAVFEHLAMPWKVSVEIIKLLKLNGYVFIETHYSYSSHERPWHFFQFSENALDILFPEKFGMKCERKGCSNLIEGRFSEYSSEYLQGKLVKGLYCHSEYLGKKVSEVTNYSWDEIMLEDVTKGALYPKKDVSIL